MTRKWVCFEACAAMYEILAKRSFSTIEKITEVSGYSRGHVQNIFHRLEEAGCVEMHRRQRDGRIRQLWKVTGNRPVKPEPMGPRRAPLTSKARSQAQKAKYESPVIDTHRLAKLNSIWSTE